MSKVADPKCKMCHGIGSVQEFDIGKARNVFVECDCVHESTDIPCPSCANKDRTIALLKAVAEAASVVVASVGREEVDYDAIALMDVRLDAARKGGAM